MKTPSPTKLTAGYRSPSHPSPPTSPDKNANRKAPSKLNSQPYDKPLAVMGHSMVSRGGDPESDMTGLNIDLRLITGRMAQTLNSYEGKTAKYASDQIRDVESRLDEIDNPILKVQIKDILSNYKHLAQEREHILHTLDAWFDHCSDEFLEELEEFESNLEGEDSLSDHISQAKDIITKIKYINSKISDFQNNGLSTEKLVAQKKTLEDELMKKKIIVDNTQTGSQGLVLWKENVLKISEMVKESGASEIDKALLDMKISETGEHVSAQLISMERTSRRVGVLFKNVKELEYNNGQLAEENSFLKQQLSKFDKNYKNHHNKKLAKLDCSLDELENVKYGKGSTTDDVNNGRVPFDMEMIENYQDQVHTLNVENKDLITKVDTLEEQADEYKEEVTALEAKLHKSMTENEKIKNTVIETEHPLIKFDRGPSQDDYYSIGSVSNTNLTDTKSSHVPAISRRNTIVKKGARPSIVSTITIQDGTELEALKMDNQLMRSQIQKLKMSLKNTRKRSIKSNKINQNTQTKMMWNNTEGTGADSFVEESSSEEEEEEEETESSAEGEEAPVQKEKVPCKPKKRKKKVIKKSEEKVPSNLSEESYDNDENDEEEEDEEDDIVKDTELVNKNKDDKAADLESAFNQDRQRRLSRKLKRLAAEAGTDQKASPVESPQPAEIIEKEENLSGKDKSARPLKQFVLKKREKKNKFKTSKRPEQDDNTPDNPKAHVTFEEPEESEEDYTPTFERVPTPKVETDNTIVTLEKVKEELKEFLSYGQKFMSSIHLCIVDAADDDLALKMDNYSELEQKITGLDTSLNILLYGIDLGMFLATADHSRPTHSPLPFENKLYFQENLSKYLREKYPKLNVNAMKLFDPELDAMTSLHPIGPPGHTRKSPDFKPYPTQPKPEYIDHFMLPLTTTPEPKVRKLPRKVYKRKPIKRDIAIGKIEEIMASLTSGAMFGKKDEKDTPKQILDERSFAEIVDHVMPKEMAMEYMKLIQPTHDTLGKKQYNEKLKRGVMKVKDLLDLMNLSNQGVLKGLPSNKLGEPRNRLRQTKVNHTNLTASDLIGQGSPQPATNRTNETYKNRLTRHDRVQASLDDYSYHQEGGERDELKSSGSLTVVELPLTPRTQGTDKKSGRSSSKTDVKEDLFDFTKSNPNMNQLISSDKRSLLPVVTQKLLPHSEAKNFPTRKVTKKTKKISNQPSNIDQSPPQVSDILNLEWEKSKLSSVNKLPKISATGEMTDQTY